jgi:hypothetical protein
MGNYLDGGGSIIEFKVSRAAPVYNLGQSVAETRHNHPS